MTVRSTVLGRGVTPSSVWTVIYRCPVGWRTIVREIRYDGSGQGPTHVTVLFQIPDATVSMNIVAVDNPGNMFGVWSGWTVLNPGDTIDINSTAVPVSYWASGTLLQLTGSEAL